ncbi:ROK family protein [Specibacter cremeus]|uniref:ROK family protein n=1 Tax=Specibacter cremeus TaxID=1629051 RepID=UPI000F78ADA0|nr:ROK family protein [Specibacter cremeus]
MNATRRTPGEPHATPARPGPGGTLADTALELARAVLVQGPVSRRRLAAELKLSVASLTRLSKPLLDAGWLVEGDLIADGSVGRPVRLLDVPDDARHFFGVKVTGTALQAVVTDLRATILASGTVELADRSVPGVVEAIAGLAGALADRAGVTVSGMGVSLGGRVMDDGTVLRAPFLGWRDVALGPELRQRTGLPVRLENDVLALAAAQQWFGAGRDTPDFAVITVGAGVGYGLVMNHTVVRTGDSGLGLGGHIPLAANGPLCAAGHRGCSTAMLAMPSLCAQISTALARPVDYPEALDLAASGNPVAAAVFDAAGRALGRLIALTANLAMVNTVVVAGEGVDFFALVAESVRGTLEADRDPDAAPVRVPVLSSGYEEWARGAAAVAIQDQAFVA